jgi:nitrogen regulatory protein PII
MHACLPAKEKSTKEIKAYIKPYMLSHVVNALSSLEGLSGCTVTQVLGFDRSRAKGSGIALLKT